MLKKIIEYRYMLASSFLASLGALMLLWESLQLIPYVDDLCSRYEWCKIFVFCLVTAGSVCYAFWKLFKKTESLTLEINQRTELTIKVIDLMKAPGLRVIPVNEYFDTHKGDGIINPSSLHGKFLTLFEDDIPALHAQIDKQLAVKEALPSNRVRNMVEGLPQKRYPLGTCIRITKDDQAFLLVALTRFNSEEHVEVATEEYTEVIRKLYNGIENYQNGGSVYMPLIGSGISGYQLSNMQMLNTIVQSAHNADRLSVTKGITVCIYNDDQLKTLNLNVIEYLYNRWRTLK